MIILRTFSKKKETEQKNNKEESDLVSAGKKGGKVGALVGVGIATNEWAKRKALKQAHKKDKKEEEERKKEGGK